MGVLPTKGLTLPLMSYGGSSLIVSFAAIGLLMRIYYECSAGQAMSKSKGKAKKPEKKKRAASLRDVFEEAA